MRLFSILAALGLVATAAAQGNAGGSQASCSAAQAWTLKGCYDDTNNNRHLGFAWQLTGVVGDPKYYPGFTTGQMSVDICTTACRGHGHRYAALYGGTNCYCAVNFPLYVHFGARDSPSAPFSEQSLMFRENLSAQNMFRFKKYY